MTPRHRAALLIALIALAAAPMANAKIAGNSLAGLVHSADRIVIARVQRVRSVGQVRVAEAIPERQIKGDALSGSIYFVASPTWTCDSSHAVAGERALLFLFKAPSKQVETKGGSAPVTVPQSPLYYLVTSGRGRMPLRTVGGQEYASVSTGEVYLPKHLETISEPGRGPYSRIRSVGLNSLLAEVTRLDRHLAENPPAP